MTRNNPKPVESNLDAPAEELTTDPTLDAPAEEIAAGEYRELPQEDDASSIIVEGSGDIEVVSDEDHETITSLQPERIARAVQIEGDEVTNVILVGVDKDDNPVGFETPYGTETIVVEDDSPVAIGWKRSDDGEFANPNE